MSRILEWKTWDTYNKYSKARIYHGYALIDTVYNSDAEQEEAAQEVNRLHKQRWEKVMQKLKLKSTSEVPNKIVHQLGDLYAEEMRQVYGRNRKDAGPLYTPKRIDLLKVAEKHNLPVGQEGWGQMVINAIEDGTIKV